MNACICFLGFIDALTDPRAYLSAQEKRAQQLKDIGIDESDIATDVIIGSGKSGATNKSKKPGMPQIHGVPAAKKPDEKGT